MHQGLNVGRADGEFGVALFDGSARLGLHVIQDGGSGGSSGGGGGGACCCCCCSSSGTRESE